MYWFISGYTAKVAGTERGVTEPAATFSTLLRRRRSCRCTPPSTPSCSGAWSRSTARDVWLVNTGWTGGPHGVGERISIAHSRAVVRSALAGELDAVETVEDPVFGFAIPTSCPGVPAEVLQPRQTWADPAAYDEAARSLARLFADNFEQFADATPESVLAAGPSVTAPTA